MTDAPKRIWAWITGIQPLQGNAGLWRSDEGTITDDEYILTADVDRMIAEKDARIAELEARLEIVRCDAFAATNPANWRNNDTLQERIAHYEKTLMEISARNTEITILEDTYAWGVAHGEHLISEAVAAERERCARVVEPDGWEPECCRDTLLALAAAIRAAKEGK